MQLIWPQRRGRSLNVTLWTGDMVFHLIRGLRRCRAGVEYLFLILISTLFFQLFVAEPFAIPTGSMAPTLIGRHKRYVCPLCDQLNYLSTSAEVDWQTGWVRAALVSAECSNCRAELDITDWPTSAGERVLVWKEPWFGYRRWQLVVFHAPDQPRQLHVKRIVGLPGERIRVARGEIERWDVRAGTWQLLRKPPALITELARLVHETRQPNSARAVPAQRWFPAEPSATTAPTSQTAAIGKPPTEAPTAPSAWRWHAPATWHLVAGDTNTLAAETPQRLVYRHSWPGQPEPRLITDDDAYNSGLSAAELRHAWLYRLPSAHPVQDLLLEFEVTLTPASRWLEVTFQTGQDQLRWYWSRRRDRFVFERNGHTIATKESLWTPGQYQVRVANVDAQLLFWLDQQLWLQQPYEPAPLTERGPTSADLTPISVAAAGPGTTLSHLTLRRDLYYTRAPNATDYFPPGGRQQLAVTLADPSRWARLQQIRPMATAWQLGPQDYLVLGDNSQHSQDSRSWQRQATITPQAILGRPVLRLWPWYPDQPRLIR